ncbi:hypothetical protein V6N12_036428 [Hibiscus sabdariffa]|uniref:Photosystem II cytochrome b559 N-terminal domain-containing protein n=1 Tax=Hibiscus sabdariffa TaxID=183260 RepID=A0ABR2ET60_9ROSI
MPNTNKKGRRKWLGFRSMLSVPHRGYKIEKNALDGCPGIEKEGRFQSEKAFYPSPFLTFPGKETASTETSKEEDLERKLKRTVKGLYSTRVKGRTSSFFCKRCDRVSSSFTGRGVGAFYATPPPPIDQGTRTIDQNNKVSRGLSQSEASTGERSFADIITSIRYWVIHSITIPSLFIAGWLFVSTEGSGINGRYYWKDSSLDNRYGNWYSRDRFNRHESVRTQRGPLLANQDRGALLKLSCIQSKEATEDRSIRH